MESGQTGEKKNTKNTHAMSLDDDSSASCHMSAMKSFKAPGGSRKSTTTGSPQKKKQSHQQPAKASPNRAVWGGEEEREESQEKGGDAKKKNTTEPKLTGKDKPRTRKIKKRQKGTK